MVTIEIKPTSSDHESNFKKFVSIPRDTSEKDHQFRGGIAQFFLSNYTYIHVAYNYTLLILNPKLKKKN